MRRFVWPPGSHPVVEVDGRWRATAKDSALRAEWSRIEGKRWAAAGSWADLCELVAQFCEGKLTSTPDHGGGRCAETVPVAAELAHANRQGFLTTCSQSGEDEPWGDSGERFQQRPAVEGYASPETVQKLRALIAGTRLEMQVVEKRPLWRTDFSNGVNVTRSLWPDGTQEWHTGFGVVPSQRAHFSDLGRPDLTEGAHVVTIYDPEYGDRRLLWERLGQPDWNNPKPPAAKTEPPVSASRDVAVGVVEGLSTVTPTGLAAAAASSATGKDIKSPAANAGGATTGAGGGAGMASAEEMRAAYAAAAEKLREVAEKAGAARAQAEEVQGEVSQVTEGSGKTEAEEAKGAVSSALEKLTEAYQQAEISAQAMDTMAAAQ